MNLPRAASSTPASEAVQGPSGQARQDGIVQPRDPVVASSDLLQGRKAVEISHNGTLYRLQATRLGKLILTK